MKYAVLNSAEIELLQQLEKDFSAKINKNVNLVAADICRWPQKKQFRLNGIAFFWIFYFLIIWIQFKRLNSYSNSKPPV